MTGEGDRASAGGRRVLQGLGFFPRGGSSHVVRSLTRTLRGAGWDVRIVCGSLGAPGDPGHAASFFDGLPVCAADLTSAFRAWRRGEDPLDQPVPFHPSYENRPDAPDRVFASVSPRLAEGQVAAWQRQLAGSGHRAPDLLHLHHLTPLHEAASRVWPDVPVVTHLHGTELAMLERIACTESARRWPYADYWAGRMQRAARRSARVLVAAPDLAERAAGLLCLSPDRIAVVPNGVDTAQFRPRELSADERLSRLRQWLVDDPRGWDESAVPGSIRYSPGHLAEFVDDAGCPRPVLLFVGRFTQVKRLNGLIRAYARVRHQLGPVAPLVVWGGFPGEWEGEHPYSLTRRLGIDGVYFVGWRDHDDLRLGLACADLLVAPSVGEAFGSVYLEAMASGLPVIATSTGGPVTFLNQDPRHPEGWLVRPDDEDDLIRTLIDALSSAEDRRARGAAAERLVRQRFTWVVVTAQLLAVYRDVLESQCTCR